MFYQMVSGWAARGCPVMALKAHLISISGWPTCHPQLWEYVIWESLDEMNGEDRENRTK